MALTEPMYLGGRGAATSPIQQTLCWTPQVLCGSGDQTPPLYRVKKCLPPALGHGLASYPGEDGLPVETAFEILKPVFPK